MPIQYSNWLIVWLDEEEEKGNNSREEHSGVAMQRSQTIHQGQATKKIKRAKSQHEDDDVIS
jgi:hypothetical protein